MPTRQGARLSWCWLGLTVLQTLAAPPGMEIDLLADPNPDTYTRVHGALGTGRFGVPVCGGMDCDGDGFADAAFSSMAATFLGRGLSGIVTVVWGDGGFGRTLDSGAADQQDFLRIAGAQALENCGSEIWMDDVDGDGLGDLLVCRQNASPTPQRRGAGILTIVFGSETLRHQSSVIDLANPRDDLSILHIQGRNAYDRLGIWVRAGDLDGDGIAELAVGADEADRDGEINRGEVYIIRGGPHLREAPVINLASFPPIGWEEHVIRVAPPSGSGNGHFGATLQFGDLDGNDRAEFVVAATLERAGAGLRLPNAPANTGQSEGGTGQGVAYILWDTLFAEERWEPGYEIDLDDYEDDVSVLRGSSPYLHFGEELIAGGDFDGDGRADLFVSDLKAFTPNGVSSGRSALFFHAANLRGREIVMGQLPDDVRVTEIIGVSPGALSGDSAAFGDFDRDGVDDLALSNPHAHPKSRINAGSLHVLYGKRGLWPTEINLANDQLPQQEDLRSAWIAGARGNTQVDVGDVLAYSLAVGDMDGDGGADLIFNEMQGNGVRVRDVGNLILYNGDAMLPPQLVVPEPSLTLTDEKMPRLQWFGRHRHRYQLERSRDLAAWESVGEPLEGEGVLLEQKDAPGNDATLYYRLATEVF